MEEKRIYTAVIENTPIEVINIIEQELAEMIGNGCAHMFVQAIYDDVVISNEKELTKDNLSKIYLELKHELKGLLGELGLNRGCLRYQKQFPRAVRLALRNVFH